jgi:hypothetical protein
MTASYCSSHSSVAYSAWDRSTRSCSDGNARISTYPLSFWTDGPCVTTVIPSRRISGIVPSRLIRSNSSRVPWRSLNRRTSSNHRSVSLISTSLSAHGQRE